MTDWNEFIFSGQPFDKKMHAIFEYQWEHNAVYQRFCKALDVTLDSLSYHPESDSGSKKVWDDSILPSKGVPLLPIQAFKDAKIVTGEKKSENHRAKLIFKSSGTGGMSRSIHHVSNESIYRQSVLTGFNDFYDFKNAVILGYTPGYAANPHSSLIWMINELISQDEIDKSRFLPIDKPLSQGEVDDIAASGKQLILFGAAFGLMDLMEISSVKLPSNSVVIETGGMKTHRRELSRSEMHHALAAGFRLDSSRIHSEYGMCELLSQAYATGGKWFRSVPWMQVSVRDPDNPQRILPAFSEGILGVIDLANVHSCSFILTGDRGLMDRKGRFQVLGRWKPSDLRGCNFLIDRD